MIRIARRVLLLLVSGGALLLLGLVALHAGAGTWAVNSLARTVIPGATISVDHVAGNYLSGIELRGVRVVRGDGAVPLRSDTVRIGYDLRQLLSGNRVVRRIQLIAPVVTLQQSLNGSWNPFPSRPRNPASSPSKKSPAVTIEEFSIVRGTAGIRSVNQPDQLRLRFAGHGSLAGRRLTLGGLVLRSESSTVVGNGSITLPRAGEPVDFGGMNLDMEASPLALRDLRSFHSDFDREESGRVKARIRGNGSDIAITLDAALAIGGTLVLRGRLTPPKQSPLQYSADAVIQDFDLSSFLGRRPAPRVNGKVVVDVRGERLTRLDGKVRVELSDRTRSVRATADLDQGKAQVNLRSNLGLATASITGWVRPFDSAPAYDLRARMRLAQSTTPQIERWLGTSSRSVAFRLRGSGLPPHHAVGWASARVEPASTGAPLLDSVSVSARLNGRSGRVQARAGVSHGLVALEGTATWGSALKLRIQRGTVEEVNLATLLGDSNWTRLNGRLSLNLDVDSGGIRLASRSELNDATLSLRGGRSTGPQRILDVQQLSFKHLDLARFFSTQPSTNLNGFARLRARGRDLKTAIMSGQVRLEDSRLGREEVKRAHMVARLDRGTIRAQGAVGAQSGQLTFSGSARPFDRVPSYAVRQLSFADLDLGRLLHQERLKARLAGSLTAEGKGRTADDARLSATLNLQHSTIDRAVLAGGRIEATLSAGQLEILGSLKGRHDSVLIGAAISPFDEHPKVRLLTRVPITELASAFGGDSALDAHGTMNLAVAGKLGRPDNLSLQGELQADGQLGGLRLDSLGATLQLRDGVARLDSFTLRSNVGAASGAGTMGLFGKARSGPARLRLGAKLTELAPLAPYAGVADLGLDSGRVIASADGTRDSLRLALSLQARGLATSKQRIDELDASAGGQLAAGRRFSGSAQLSAQGIRSGKTSLRSILAQGSSRGGEFHVRGEVLVDSHRDAQLVARVRPRAHGGEVQLDTLNARIGENHWALRHPVELSYGDRIRVNDFVLAAGSRRIAVDGVIDPRGQQAFKVSIDSLRLLGISQFLGLGELDGELNGSVDLGGPARTPELTAGWDVDLRSRGDAIGTAQGRVEWRGDGLKLEASVSPSKGDSLWVKGRFPLVLSLPGSGSAGGLVTRISGGELALDAVGREIDISKVRALLDREKARDLKGKLSVDAHARGTLDAPRLSGDVTLRDGRIRIPSLGATYEGSARLRLQGQEVQLAQARIEAGKGRMDLSGSVRLDAFPTAAFDLTSQLREFRVASTEELRASLSGKLHLGGNSGAPLLNGTIQLHHTDFHLQAKNLQQSAEPVELSAEDLEVLDHRFGPEVARRSQQSQAPLNAWGLGVDLALSENTWLRRRSDPVIAVELSGKLQVKKKPGEELQVFGQIEPLVGRSFMQLMSRRFDLKSGAVQLSGPLNQARLALQAEYSTTASGSSTPVVITAAVKSDTGKLEVTLGSRPTMRDADIVSYLTTGRPASTDPTLESDEQGVLTTGASLAFGAALGSVAGRAGQSLGLDVVQVLQDRQGGQTVVAGKYVSPPLYLGFRQPIVPPSTAAGSSTQDEAVEFEVEYAALRQMLVNLQGGGNDLRVFLRLRR